MSAFLAFLGTFLLSLFVALLAALQLADHFGATDTVAVVLAALAAFVLFSQIVLAFAGARVRRPWLLNWIAVALASVAVAPLALPWLLQGTVAVPPLVPEVGTATALEFAIPAVIAVLVQWGLIRRRWQLVRGDEELSLWPWFTTAVAGLAILNPIGLEFVSQSIADRSVAWLPGMARPWALGGTCVLIAMTLVEYYIRGWMRRRRMSQSPLPVRFRAAG